MALQIQAELTSQRDLEMRETEDSFDLANFFDEDNQDQIKVYKVVI